MVILGLTLEQLIITVLIAFVPSIIYTILIRYVEKYDREPWGNIFSVFLWGATMAIILMILIRGVFKVHFAEYYPKLASDSAYFLLLTACVVTPIVAELLKPIGLFFVSGDIEESEDGLIYGAVAGLGFAATDSLLYGIFLAPLYGIRTFASIIIIRSISVILIHSVTTAIVGYGFSRATAIRHKKGRLYAFPAFLLLAIAIHSAFNYLAITNPQLGTVTLGDFGAVAGSLVFSGALSVIMMIIIYSKIYKLDRMDAEEEKKAREAARERYPEAPISAHGFNAEPPPVYPTRQHPPVQRTVGPPPGYPPQAVADPYAGYPPGQAAYYQQPSMRRAAAMPAPAPRRRRRAAPPPPRRQRAPPPPPPKRRRRPPPPPPRKKAPPPPPPRRRKPPPPPPPEEEEEPEAPPPAEKPPKKEPKKKPKKKPVEEKEEIDLE
ncbi:MAG: PrsW family intramembrane metalloprotease, partial [Thermoplasmata archaeon]|nr:PrsW family intramembrane metalloprotease [Thermoplasmata archaeon]